LKIYEGMFLCDSRKANRDWDAVVAHVRGVLEKCGASIHSLEKWAERKLAYPVQKHTRGVYILTYFQVPDEREEAVTEIYRQVEISDTILRAMILRIKSLPPQKEPVEEAAAEGAEAPPSEAAAEPEATRVESRPEAGTGEAAREEAPARADEPEDA